MELHLFVKLIPTGIIYRIAGIGVTGYSGDGGQETDAELYCPFNLSLDDTNNLYIADRCNNVVRKINTLGIINTVAGNHIQGFSGDGGSATAAELNFESGIYVDKNQLYIVDSYNRVIHKVDIIGNISTVCGIPGVYGFSGNGGPATAAELYSPAEIQFDISGNYYFNDLAVNVVREVNSFNIINTIAGIPYNPGYSGDGGPATAAELNQPQEITYNAGNLYIADFDINVIREIGNVEDIEGISKSDKNGENLIIFPNPAKDEITVKLLSPNILGWAAELYDITGQKLMEKHINSRYAVLNTQYLSCGTYFLKVLMSDGNILNRKLVIIK